MALASCMAKRAQNEETCIEIRQHGEFCKPKFDELKLRQRNLSMEDWKEAESEGKSEITAESVQEDTWYVLQVRTGREEVVAKQCQKLITKNILKECFLPKYERQKKYQGKWHTEQELLFPGYLFLVVENGRQRAEVDPNSMDADISTDGEVVANDTSLNEKRERQRSAVSDNGEVDARVCSSTSSIRTGFSRKSDDGITVIYEAMRHIPELTKILKTGEAFMPISEEERNLLLLMVGDSRVAEHSVGYIENEQVHIISGPMQNLTGYIRRIDRHKRIAELEVEMFGRKVNATMGLEVLRKG